MSNHTSLSTSSSLIDGVKQHDEEAWRRLVNIYGPTIYEWSRRVGLQPCDAADVVQQVFETITQGVGRFQHDDGGSFRGWIWTIFRSRLMDFYREARQQPHLSPDKVLEHLSPWVQEHEPPPADPHELCQLVRQSLRIIREDFSETTWQAFWRSTVLRERTSHVAADLCLTPAAVCMCRARVLRRMRETLSGLGLWPDEPG